MPEVVKGDPLRLRQVLQNILGNAVKFTEFGTVDVNVKIARQTEKRVEILTEVTDTGVGISPRHVSLARTHPKTRLHVTIPPRTPLK